ncbi:TolB-like translocation protein [Desulfogranum japonicum]|uniref:hypothetical protein n=1 Tax=Desulfogranum japonicum TaxID=231447 RepID=UPI00048F6C95|nr:hypothetical protein [Desulfogranum japonicum]
MTKSIHKNSLSHSALLVAVFILLFPHHSQADAINPLFNLFTPDTVVPASILTVLIIFVEALLLWKWVKPVSFLSSLWRATIINIISSAAGSITAWIFFKEQMIWGMMGLYIPMFFLTMTTETPALKFLYRKEAFDWKRTIKVSFGLNIISYLFVFTSQFGLIFAYLVYAGFADNYSIKNWTDVSLLKEETGYIYTIERLPSTNSLAKHIVKKYDVANSSWETIDPGFQNDGNDLKRWDVQSNILAYIRWIGTQKSKTGVAPYFSLTVLDEGTLSTIIKMKGSFADVRVSPDLSKLAVLETTTQNIYVPKDNESHFRLGEACALNIYDLKSGALINTASRFSLNEGLAWTNDSKNIIFSSLRNETLMQIQEDKSTTHFYGRSHAEPGQFPIDLFIFNLETSNVESLVEGFMPTVIPSSNELTFLRESGFYKREIWKMDIEKRTPSLVIKGSRDQYAISPSGKRYLIQVPHKQILGDNYFLVVVDPNDNARKYIIDPSYRYYDFRWIQ